MTENTTVDEKATSNPYLTPFLYGNITFDDIIDQNLRRTANLTLQQSRQSTTERLSACGGRFRLEHK